VLIRIEGSRLPGLTLGPGPDFPAGHRNVHVAVQGRKGQQDLHGLVAGDASSARWELTCAVRTSSPAADLAGPLVQGGPGRRFLYLSWGDVDETDSSFTMFRRAKLWLDAVPGDVMTRAVERGLLVGRLELTDAVGWPICASVRPPQIDWIAP
jgi:hypothetical protein